MLSYAEIEKLEKQGKPHYQHDIDYCAICGRKLWYMDMDDPNKGILEQTDYYRYNYCKKCKVIKTFSTIWTNSAILGKYEQ